MKLFADTQIANKKIFAVTLSENKNNMLIFYWNTRSAEILNTVSSNIFLFVDRLSANNLFHNYFYKIWNG